MENYLGNVMIFVTGGLGFIGKWVLKHLLKHTNKPYDIRTIDTIENASRILENYSQIDYSNLDKLIINHRWDISNTGIMTVFQTLSPKTVIHLASPPNQQAVENNSIKSANTMIIGLINILECARISNVQKFVYVSSSMVYGNWNSSTELVSEDHECNPKGLYAQLKLCGEQIVKEWAKKNNRQAVIIRPSAVYGPGDYNTRVVSHFINSAINKQDIIVRGPNDVLDFTWVDDLAWGISASATNKLSRLVSVYNMTRSQPECQTLLDLAHTVQRVVDHYTNHKANIVVLDRDHNYPVRGRLNCASARAELAFNPMVDIESGIEAIVQNIIE